MDVRAKNRQNRMFFDKVIEQNKKVSFLRHSAELLKFKRGGRLKRFNRVKFDQWHITSVDRFT